MTRVCREKDFLFFWSWRESSSSSAGKGHFRSRRIKCKTSFCYFRIMDPVLDLVQHLLSPEIILGTLSCWSWVPSGSPHSFPKHLCLMLHSISVDRSHFHAGRCHTEDKKWKHTQRKWPLKHAPTTLLSWASGFRCKWEAPGSYHPLQVTLSINNGSAYRYLVQFNPYLLFIADKAQRRKKYHHTLNNRR